MKKIVKLFAVTLVCGLFLAGCGGGSSDNSGGIGESGDNLTPITLDLIESSFPPFTHYADDIASVQSNKIYEVSA
ncbi:MAG: hypothetical protein LBH45_07525, partial [Campylobacteraceae bacterium]|nr:hypothetical protein [Campylobacteraceae bacterium]